MPCYMPEACPYRSNAYLFDVNYKMFSGVILVFGFDGRHDSGNLAQGEHSAME